MTGVLMARCAETPLHQLHKPLPMPREAWQGWKRDAEKSGLSEQLGACTHSPWCLFYGNNAPATAQRGRQKLSLEISRWGAAGISV